MEDSTIKNRWPDRHFSEERNKALDALKFGTGSYGAAMGVVSAALEWPFRIVASNEFAKFLRSLVLPALFIAGWQLWSEHAIAALTLEVIGAGTSVAFLKMRDPGSVASRRSALLLIAGTAFGLCAVIAARKGHEQTLLLLAVSALSLSGYLCLKHLHMSLVYEAAKDIKEKNNNSGPKPKYVEIELPDKFDRKVCLVFWDGKLVGSAMAR
jgi:hypothetical protein